MAPLCHPAGGKAASPRAGAGQLAISPDPTTQHAQKQKLSFISNTTLHKQDGAVAILTDNTSNIHSNSFGTNNAGVSKHGDNPDEHEPGRYGDNDGFDPKEEVVLTQNSGNKTPFTVGTPTVPTTLHKFTNMPWEIQDTIWDLSLPQRIAPACLPSKSKPCTSIGPIVHVCKRAKARALNSQTGWVNITVFDKVDNEGNLCPDAGPDKLAPLWFNGRRDLIYLEQGAAFNALGESDTFDDNELMQKVVADPSVGLLIDTHITLSIRDELELAWELLPDEQADDPDAVIQFAEKPAAQVLYEAIKMRQHIYLELFHIEVRLTGRRRDEVVRAGMFGQAGEDPAIIHAANFDEVQKYADLLETEKIKVHNGAYSRVPAELTNFLKERRWDWDVLGPQAPREFFVNLMETVLNYAGHGTLSPLSDDDDDDQDEDDDQELHTVQDEDGTPGDGDDTEESTWEVDELIDEDGRLVEERPLVEELDLVLPRWTPVVVFELATEDMAL